MHTGLCALTEQLFVCSVLWTHVVWLWLCCSKEEQQENPTAVIHALKAYDQKLRSFKTQKYIAEDTDSSTSSMNDELGISSDESLRTTQSCESTDAVVEHVKVTCQSSVNTACETTSPTASVSIIALYPHCCSFVWTLCLLFYVLY